MKNPYSWGRLFRGHEEREDRLAGVKVVRRLTLSGLWMEDKSMYDDYRNIVSEAVNFSRGRMENVSRVIQKSEAGRKLESLGVALVVAGSLGRLESLSLSDIDLVTLCPSMPSDEVKALDKAIRSELRRELGAEVSQGDNFTGPTFLVEVVSPSQIGGTCDNVNLLTKRACILTETRAVLNETFASEFRRKITREFLRTPEVRRRYFIPLIDEVVRYYRTLCIDYKSRVDYEGKPWALRYLKLRCSRKYWFFSLVLGFTSLIIRSEPVDDAGDNRLEELLLTLLDETPTVRIEKALALAGISLHQPLFAHYGLFLREMSHKETRENLRQLEYGRRHDSPLFMTLKHNADHLHRSMVEIIESMPPMWRRHLLSRFLLHS